MAGHSHWARIKRKKGVTDARRGRLWSKLSRAIIVAAKNGGGDPEQNLTLRYAIDKAKEANMPKDTIENAVKKGAGELGTADFETLYYEGYGSGGVAVLVEAMTDNRNRTAPEIKKIFERAGGNMGASGCVQWMFTSKGQVMVAAGDADEDKIAEIALEAGADDYKKSDDVWEISCEPVAYDALCRAVDNAGLKRQSSELSMVPANTVPVDGDTARKVLRMFEELEEHDDVQNVYANFEIPDDVMASLE